jgi:preprotein translocase subunit SecG
MQAVVLTIHLLLALALILVVLLQRSEGGALGMGGGGGIMTSRGAATALSKLTWALGTAFVVTSLVLTVLAARNAGVGSVVDRVTPSAPLTAPSAPVAPGLEGDLLPPPPTPAPTGAEAPAPGAPAPATPVPAAPAPSAPAADGPAAPPPVE